MVGGFDSLLVELLLRVLVDIVEVIFEDDEDFENGDFENCTVGFAGEMIDLIGKLVEFLICSVLDLKIGFAFKGVFHADVDSVGDFAGSSVISGVLEGFFESFDNFG